MKSRSCVFAETQGNRPEVCVCISPESILVSQMKTSDEEYGEALTFLREKLAAPEPEVDQWLNEIVDKWIASREAKRSRRAHG